ncbi:MAG: hypothetical protein ACLGIG_10465 [Actinomycetes bacterium]
MKPPDLRELDRRLVPEAARRLAAVVATSDRAVRRGVATARRAAERASQQAVRLSRRADERLPSTGPLSHVRAPQLALLLVVVLVSGTFAAVQLGGDEPSSPAPGAGESLLRTATLGVPAGDDVEQYLASTASLVQELALRRPDAEYLALVSLDAYLPVGQLPDLVAPTRLQRVYLRAQTADAELVEVPLAQASAATVLPALCAATASRKEADADNLRKLAGALPAGTPEQQRQRSEYLATADTYAKEAAAYSGPCATAFSALVEGSAADLAALLERPGVRGVEAAPVGITALDVDVRPLLPETTGTAPTGTER